VVVPVRTWLLGRRCVLDVFSKGVQSDRVEGLAVVSAQ